MGYDATEPDQDTRHWMLLKVGDYESSGIENVLNGNDESESLGEPVYYDALGHRVKELQPGLNIVVRGGNVVKILK